MRSLSSREYTSLDRSPMKVSAAKVGVIRVRVAGRAPVDLRGMNKAKATVAMVTTTLAGPAIRDPGADRGADGAGSSAEGNATRRGCRDGHGPVDSPVTAACAVWSTPADLPIQAERTLNVQPGAHNRTGRGTLDRRERVPGRPDAATQPGALRFG